MKYIVILLFIMRMMNSLFGANATIGKDTLQGYFLLYSYTNKNLDYVEKFDVVIPLNLKDRIVATDSFNTIISNKSNYLSFLTCSPKVFVDLDFPDIQYLIKKNVLVSEEDIHYSDNIFQVWKRQPYQLVKYDCQYKNISTSLFLFRAEIIVYNLDNISHKNCCDFEIMDNIICYPLNFNNNCTGPVIINLKILP